MDASIEFLKDEKGVVTHLMLNQGPIRDEKPRANRSKLKSPGVPARSENLFRRSWKGPAENSLNLAFNLFRLSFLSRRDLLPTVKVWCRNIVINAPHNDFHKTELNRKETLMRTRLLAISAILVAALVLAFAAISMAADDPFVGIWKQDLTRIPNLRTINGVLQTQTVTITVQGNGYKMVHYI